ncbi:MAG: hypothetical protein QOI10_1090 [Solirubrobacterales bacterium]|nr:hypothetical protein [Solirubrobacterales bacterium]
MNFSILTKRALAVGAGALAMAVVIGAPASAASKDRNHDKIPDRWEARHGLSLDKNQARRDQDRDGLANRGEFRAKFDPQDPDTDDDAVQDGDEGAGTVGSFDSTTGTLVINLFGGGTVTGQVTADTEIDCNNDDATQPDDEGDDGDDNDSDDVGDDVGDDQGDDGPGHDRVIRSHGSDDNGDDGDNGDEGDDCSAADLTAGTVIHEADVTVTAAGLVFDEIEL